MMNRDSLWRDISAAALDSMKIFEEEQQLRWLTLFLDSYYKFE
jgi:hypothetical protein